jgi:hypothetical protein
MHRTTPRHLWEPKCGVIETDGIAGPLLDYAVSRASTVPNIRFGVATIESPTHDHREIEVVASSLDGEPHEDRDRTGAIYQLT